MPRELTSDSRGRSDNDVDQRLVWVLITFLSLDGTICRSCDGVASVRVRSGTVSLWQR